MLHSHEIFTPNIHFHSVNLWSGLITPHSTSPCAKQPKVNICSRQFGKHWEAEGDWEGGNGVFNWLSEVASQSLYLLCTESEWKCDEVIMIQGYINSKWSNMCANWCTYIFKFIHILSCSIISSNIQRFPIINICFQNVVEWKCKVAENGNNQVQVPKK